MKLRPSIQQRQPMQYPHSYKDQPSRYHLPQRLTPRSTARAPLNPNFSHLSPDDLSRMTIEQILLAGKSARAEQMQPGYGYMEGQGQGAPPTLEMPPQPMELQQQRMAAGPEEQRPVYDSNTGEPVMSGPANINSYTTPSFRQIIDEKSKTFQNWLHDTPLHNSSYPFNSPSTAISAASPLNHHQISPTALSMRNAGLKLNPQLPFFPQYSQSPELSTNQPTPNFNPATRELPIMPQGAPQGMEHYAPPPHQPKPPNDLEKIKQSQTALLDQLRNISKGMTDLQLQQHERDREMISLKMELSDQKKENKELRRDRNSQLSLLRGNSRKELSRSIDAIPSYAQRRPSKPESSQPRTPPNMLTSSQNGSISNQIDSYLLKESKREQPVSMKPGEVQTEETLIPPSQKMKEAKKKEQEEIEIQLKTLAKEKSQLIIQLEAQRDSQRQLKKRASKATEMFASFASGVESQFIFVSEYADHDEEAKERQKLLQRFKSANDEVKAKQDKIQKTLQLMRAEQEQQLKERREFEKQLAQQSNDLFDLQKKIDASKDNDRRAQKILESNSLLSDENRDLKSELKLLNEQQQQKCQQQDELIEIQQKAVNSLKSNISLSKNRTCNNCLLYINEKQDFQLKVEQQVRVLQRMERDHHEEKEKILQACQDAMEELQRFPSLHQNKINRISQELKGLRADNKALSTNLQNMQALREKREMVLHNKESELSGLKEEIQSMKDRINSHDDELLMLEKEIETAEKERQEIRRNNDQLTTQVGKNATKKLMIKDREGQLEDERSRLRKQMEAILNKIDSLPKKIKNKILKK